MTTLSNNPMPPPQKSNNVVITGSIKNKVLMQTLIATTPIIAVSLFLVAVAAGTIQIANPFAWGIVLIIGAILITGALAFGMANSVAEPITQIANSVTHAAQGDLSQQIAIPLGRSDEIALLAYNFNLMIDTVQDSVNKLEVCVEEKDQDVEAVNGQLQKLIFQLETRNTINNLIAPTIDVKALNQSVVSFLQEHFTFHHVAILLTNDTEEQVVLSESTSLHDTHASPQSASSKMDLIPLDEQTLIGQAAVHRQPRVYPLSHQGSGNANVLGYNLNNAPPRSLLLTSAQAELALPLLSNHRLLGVLDIQSTNQATFDETLIGTLQGIANQIAVALDRGLSYQQTDIERERVVVLQAFNSALEAATDLESILKTSIRFTEHLGATFGAIYLVDSSGDVHRRYSLETAENQPHQQIPGFDTLLKSGQLARLVDTLHSFNQADNVSSSQSKSVIATLLEVDFEQLMGIVYVSHEQPNRFNEQDKNLLDALTTQISTALKNSTLLIDIQQSLQETHLMLDISQKLAASPQTTEIYATLTKNIVSAGANRASLHLCEVNQTEKTTRSRLVQLAFRQNEEIVVEAADTSFQFSDHPIFKRLIDTKEIITITDLSQNGQLSPIEKAIFTEHGAQTLLLNPMVARGNVIGFVVIEYNHRRPVNERQITLYRTMSNQATIAIENARQVKQTENALAETQTLYRAGRVLARAVNFHDILEEALVEFLYSLGLEQGGIILLTQDRKFGQLTVYVQDGLPQDVNQDESMRLPILKNNPYQEVLMAGQPFVSIDFKNDPRLKNFVSFNEGSTPQSILQAPMIVQGETVGWIGADSVERIRHFSQREIDLARAMADQIAIAIQNRRLLEQTQRRAEQMQAVAQIGESVSEMIDLNDILNNAVNLIKERFKLYHVSIFVIDDANEWAVVKASTGEVGQIMVERPHQLEVGGTSIVGYVASAGQPRIALDVGEDKVHFKNPLLPLTRSEMALPLAAHGGVVIGALDVQSVMADAFSDEDIEILQIMANQLTAAIEKANLFEETQHRLMEQATLYRIGMKIGGTLNLQTATDELVAETAEALNVQQCILSLIENSTLTQTIDNLSESSAEALSVHTLSEYLLPDSQLSSHLDEHFALADVISFAQAHMTKREVTMVMPSHYNDDNNDPTQVSAAVVPVLIRQDIVGFLTTFDENPKRQYTHQDVALLNAIALQAGTALETTRLYQRAQENERFLKTILDQLPDPIFIKNRQHQLVVVNHAYAEGLLGQPEKKLLGKQDHNYYPDDMAQESYEQDQTLFETAQEVELEQTMRNASGQKRTLYIRKTPLSLKSNGNGRQNTDYLIGVVNDITEQRLREFESERLMDSTRQTLRRTQSLYEISHAFDTVVSQQDDWQNSRRKTFKLVLQAYLELLDLSAGSIFLLNRTKDHIQQEILIDSTSADLEASEADNLPLFAVKDDTLFGHLAEHKSPLTIRSIADDPLTAERDSIYGHEGVHSLLALPLLIQRKIVGFILIVSDQESYRISSNDIELGQTITGQLARWLENAQLLVEAQYRSDRLTTVAQIAQVASSILDVPDLIEVSVNLICDQFNFYYVGLFLVEGSRAVLKSGTGEAGRTQLERNHSLEIGEGSMIGWAIENRQPKIDLNVGADTEDFYKNPLLPLTKSEMALPLASREEVLGALTIQSVEVAAFSDEDITLLQTMADQLANAIKNAELFAQSQTALSETERLYQITQELLSADDEEIVYRLATHALAQSGIDLCATYIYTQRSTHKKQSQNGSTLTSVQSKAAWSITGEMPHSDNTPLDKMLLDLLPVDGEHFVIDALNPVDPDSSYMVTMHELGLTALVLLPLASQYRQIGFLMVAYLETPSRSNSTPTFSRSQIRFYNALARQMVVALENLRLLNASRRRVRREEIIRHISSQLRRSTDVEDVLKTTVTELSKVIGSNRAGIILDVKDNEAGSPPSDLSQL